MSKSDRSVIILLIVIVLSVIAIGEMEGEIHDNEGYEYMPSGRW